MIYSLARELLKADFGEIPKPTVKSGWKKVRVKLYKYSIDNNDKTAKGIHAGVGYSF